MGTHGIGESGTNPGKRFRPILETMESRFVPTGTILVGIDAGSLVIQGDSRPNQIRVEQTGPGAFRVSGLAGERLRGPGGRLEAAPVTVNGVTGGVCLILGPGDDRAELQGTGWDKSIGANVAVVGGGGRDRIFLNAMRVGGGEYGPVLTLPRALLAQAGLIGQVAINNAKFAGSITIDTGAGDQVADGDLVFLEGVNPQGNTRIQTGLGGDHVRLNAAAFRGMALDTGAGEDLLEIGMTQEVALFSILAEMGDGNDRVTLGNGKIRLQARLTSQISGGRGWNIFEGIPNQVQGQAGSLTDPRKTGFEKVT